MLRALDLFCGGGGATRGLQLAGFHVTGVDINRQPNYIGDVFHQADAMTFPLKGYDFIWASPPCQFLSRAGHLRTAQGGKPSSVNLISRTRELLMASGTPYVIENVEGARPFMHDPMMLCGSSFGLKVQRHRLFESKVFLMSTICRHRDQGRPVGVYHRLADEVPHGGRTARTLEEGQLAMGIDWMSWDELKEAIPPAYAEFIGTQVRQYIGVTDCSKQSRQSQPWASRPGSCCGTCHPNA